MDYAKLHLTPAPQSQPIRGREADMQANDAGGFGFTLDPWDRLDRFLILGTEGGTYYASESKITLDNTANVQACLKADGPRTVLRAWKILTERRAPKVDPGLFVLAFAAAKGDTVTKTAAFTAVATACQTATHLFQWTAQYATLGGGFASGFQRAIKGWYLGRDAKTLAYQVTKYRNRHGWAHLDMLRLWHPTKEVAGERDPIFGWLKTGAVPEGQDTISAFAALQAANEAKAAAALIREYRAPREWVPVELLGKAEVWEALAESMPPVALFRNLGALGARGLLTELSDTEKLVIGKIAESAPKVHPIQPLLALGVYGAGHGEKGKLTWPVNARIVKALAAAFDTALSKAAPIGKNVLVGVDVSGSMSAPVNGYPALNCRQVACAIGLWLVNREPNSVFTWYDTTCRRYPVTDLATMIRATINPTGTDCSAPIFFALAEGIPIDLFVTITDNETWAGRVHPSEALDKYRKDTGRDAKLVTLALTATATSIADPKSPHHLNLVGLDASFPTLLQEFAGVGKAQESTEE